MTQMVRLCLLIVALMAPVRAMAMGPDLCGPADTARAMAVHVWTVADLGAEWRPPACSGWTTPGLRSLIQISGHLPISGGPDAVLTQFGAISTTVGQRYWSVTHKRWETLITAAHASDEAGRARPDFTAAELQPGRTVAFSQTDNGAGAIPFRMTTRMATPARIVIETENTGTIRLALIPLFSPGELQTLYVLDRQGDGWAYRSFTRTAPGASGLTDGHEASGVNRAAAMFRHLAGIPGDQEPPAAR